MSSTGTATAVSLHPELRRNRRRAGTLWTPEQLAMADNKPRMDPKQ
jgi:hypothetical protein